MRAGFVLLCHLSMTPDRTLFGERAANGFVCSRSSTTKVWGQITSYNPEFGLTDIIHELDPTRLVNSVSGWFDHGAGEFNDNHHSTGSQCGMPQSSLNLGPSNPSRIGFQGEFGGTDMVPMSQPSTFGRFRRLSTLSIRPTNCTRHLMRRASAAISC